MRDHPIRISTLRRLVPSATNKILIDTIHRLLEDGLIRRVDLSSATRHVEYSLAPGRDTQICNLLDCLCSVSPLGETQNSLER